MPLTIEPKAKNAAVLLTRSARRRRGAYSRTYAVTLGSVPPRPKPARKRSTTRLVTVWPKGVASEKTPKIAIGQMIACLRPILSASMPKNSAPSVRPSSPALKIGPSSAGLKPRSFAITGAT
jgi:hypothetical protein